MKNFFLTDKEIQDLVNEPKQMTQSSVSVIRGMKQKKGREASFTQNSVKFSRERGGGTWLIYLRCSKENIFDFSCGLAFIPKGIKEPFMLTRYNGKSHEHTNRLEREAPFFDFHIHQTTDRYQRSSHRDDHYAAPTNRYTDLYGAFKCLLDDAHVTDDSSGSPKQMEIFQ